MPVISMTIPDVDQAVIRPIVLDITDQIQRIVKIDKSVKILFPSDIGVNPTPQSSIHEERDRRARYDANRYLNIEVTIEDDEGLLGSTPIHQKEHPLLFLDPAVKTSMAPIYSTTNVTISFKYETISKTEANRWRDDIRARLSQMRDTNIHDITYHYQAPDELWELIKLIFDYKMRLAPDPSSFEQYVQTNSSKRLALVSDQTNKNYAYVFTEKQTRIIGQFDFSPMPEKIEREDDTARWTCAFNYKFSFERPIAMSLRYPIMVYNRILPEKHVAFTQNYYDENKRRTTRDFSMRALSQFEAAKQLEATANLYVPFQLPAFDEFKARKSVAGYANIMSVLVEVDEQQPKNIFNLRDIDPYMFDTDIQDFILNSEYQYIHHAYHSVIHMSLFEDYAFKADRCLTMDSQLNIRSVIDLDPRKIQHVVFSLIVDLPYLKEEAVKRLKKNPKAFVKIVKAINEALRDFPELELIAKKPRVTETDFLRFFRFTVGFNTKRRQGPNNLFVTPADHVALTTLDKYDKPIMTRKDIPYIPGPRNKDDPLGEYRGYDFEKIRRTFKGFNIHQLSSVIAIPKR